VRIYGSHVFFAGIQAENGIVAQKAYAAV